jgi:CRISPR-associated endoribonuclease Cas6
VRIKITAISERPSFFPYNYQYALHSAIYSLINESSTEYSKFLHDDGYLTEGINKKFKFFTFSKLKFSPNKRNRAGFDGVKKIQLLFTTSIDENLKHLILGVFSNRKIKLMLNGESCIFNIGNVDILPEPIFNNQERFVCLSPIAVSTIRVNENGKKEQHFLNYMIPEERDHFVNNLKTNLINKYETINKTKYIDIDLPFKFVFDNDYLTRRKGKISKLIEFKNAIKIKAMEAPFSIETDPKLIKLAYECGWGEKNSAGFGCVDQI